MYPDNNDLDEMCEVDGCHNLASWEGWYRVKDFAGIPTGLIQRRKVCNTHVTLLIGYEKHKEELLIDDSK